MTHCLLATGKTEFHNFNFTTEVRRMMSEMGYDFSNPCVLGKGEGSTTIISHEVLQGMESTWFTTADQGLHNFTGLGYQPTHSDMIS